MKIAIPIDEGKKNVSLFFGRTPYFLFYDAESKSGEIFKNFAAEASGGAGIKAAQFVLDNGADALITVRCGENAAALFKSAGVKIYKSLFENAMKNVEALLDGKLSELLSFHAGFHGNRFQGGFGGKVCR